MLASTLACTSAADALVKFRMDMYVPLDMKFSPMGFSHVLHLCLQGGGVFVRSGTVTISSCTISGNTAGSVRASLACKSPIALIIALKTFHRPNGKIADVLASTLACAVQWL